MKVYADRLLAEAVPDGTFGGARPRRTRGREQQRRTPDPAAARHLAELARAVAEIDHDRGYGVSLRYRQPAPPAT
ncbi:hypothetical protein ACIHCX_10840 [Streptomyces sp. NPDC052043]|uniref:hypothetical protein n=1 Tax=Streptomyces sp. NPDC052043 TaxID=3365684 RepID=UPI0037D72816